MIIYDQRTGGFWRLMEVISFLKTAVDGSFSNFHVTSKICLNRTSRYYIKTSVHSYFNIIKRSITLKCPTFDYFIKIRNFENEEIQFLYPNTKF